MKTYIDGYIDGLAQEDADAFFCPFGSCEVAWGTEDALRAHWKAEHWDGGPISDDEARRRTGNTSPFVPNRK